LPDLIRLDMVFVDDLLGYGIADRESGNPQPSHRPMVAAEAVPPAGHTSAEPRVVV
jgi:hypothetical protein